MTDSDFYVAIIWAPGAYLLGGIDLLLAGSEEMNGLAFAIVGHLVGDYILQNDYLANGKKTNSGICALHCSLWTISVMVFSGWIVPWVGPVLFITHFAQDRTTFVRWWMKRVGQDGFATHLAPWSVIAVDNTMHIAVLAIIAKCLGVHS